ncbi:hypothetical protein [Pseudomonas aeruginosa]|uniref:hypothetical protein n=1 Tax=Pseudomonas aeruginosa TaxID=287 RepID=UPI00249E9531|nr:hypothetical protein [Pseudomonas aeruginosa]WGY37586.1 hypothetical protein LGV63_33710 [Pseudomonas aeruginosa]HCI5049473.1 hypothetical protein [Pseudomonas aeruginosa]HCJ4890962.1 hypothetical protein [Pseudomonas aeruginosa]
MAKKPKGGPEIPRDDYVYGHTADKVPHLTVSFDPSGRITVREVDPDSIRRQISHVRKGKGDKVLFSAPANDFSLSRGHLDELKTRFDYLLAADTNTISDHNGPVRFSGYTASACTIAVIAEPLQVLTKEIRFQPLVSYLILDSGADTKPELLGWHLALTRHTDTPYLRTRRLGFIVDSELGKHLDINARKVPYFAEHLLPNNTALIYASGDKSEMFANQMLKYCDNIAGQVLIQFKRHDIDTLLKEPSFQVGSAVCLAIAHASKASNTGQNGQRPAKPERPTQL